MDKKFTRNQYSGLSLDQRFWEKVDKNGSGGCWLWIGALDGSGYGSIAVNRIATKAHRYSWELHFGEIPAGLLVCHKCDVRNCVRPDHLFLGTPDDNMKDKKAKGRETHFYGEQNHSSKLTEEQAREILAIVKASGETQTEIAKKFGVSRGMVGLIASAKNWVHIHDR